jgi:ABC-type glycerol-3-phosphate transport system substrate-binding protein
MKQVIAIVAIATLAACGGGVSNNPATDSATVTTDTTVKPVDTTAAPKADTSAVIAQK